MPLKIENNVWMFRQYAQNPKTKQWQVSISFNCHEGKNHEDVDKHLHFIESIEQLKINTKENLHEEVNRLYNLYVGN